MITKAYHYNGKTLALRDNITDAEGVHGLNAAFLIKNSCRALPIKNGLE